MTETEVKLSLPSSDYFKFLKLFDGNYTRNELWNIFYETNDDNLKPNVLRLRRIIKENNIKYCVTLKGKMSFQDGISRCIEIEDEIPLEKGIQMIKEPEKTFQNLPANVKEYINGCKNSKFNILGDFHDIRNVIIYKGLKIEADEMILPNLERFYELEIESESPEMAKKVVSDLLNENGINFTNSDLHKYSRLLKVPKEKRWSNEMIEFLQNK